MKHINISISESYKSIPSGFSWQAIPSFTILTGVNGVGKTHLLNILKQQEENGMQLNIPIEATDDVGNKEIFVLPSPQTRSQNLSGLISYYLDTDNRLNNISSWENAIQSWRERISWINMTLSGDSLSDSERRQLNHELKDLSNNIKSYQGMITNTIIFAYEEELKNISTRTGKAIHNFSEEDIRRYANPYFNDFSEIEDFENYVRQEHEEYKENLAIAASKTNVDEFKALASQEKPYEIINRLFLKYGFEYYEMLDPFPELKERNGEIRFVGKQKEVVEYSALSSGEQMIVKFIIMSLGRDIAGRRINTLILDEPDAHLHPTMSKMMVDILYELSQPKENGGGGIRVIITTHSSSTVAFAPEGSLFVLEKDSQNHKHIRETSASEAIEILSDGILTYDKAIQQFSLAINSDKSTIIFVEGKTDILHLNRANEILGYNLPIEIIDMHDAEALANFIKSTPAKLFPGKKFIALFDADIEGYGAFNNIKGDCKTISNAKIITASQCENHSFAMTLVAPELLQKYCPIEFLYPIEYLKSQNMLEKRNFQEFLNLYKPSCVEDANKLNDEFSNETCLRPFKVKDSNKDRFSKQCQIETDKELFIHFGPILDVIKQIIEFDGTTDKCRRPAQAEEG